MSGTVSVGDVTYASDVWFVGGWCGGSDGCPRAEPTLPCEEYLGPVPDEEAGIVDLRCPRCSWSEAAHRRRR